MTRRRTGGPRESGRQEADSLGLRPADVDAPDDLTVLPSSRRNVTEPGNASKRTEARVRSDPHPLPAGLYLVATPIGNLADITFRAVDTLRSVSVIACEDTRHTARLLAHYAVSTPTLSYHEHNAARVRPGLIARLLRGDSVALVSDAGTPLISDPGYKLVAAVVASGIPVIPIPGPSAGIAALTVSALPTDRFLFTGFPPSKASARARFYSDLESIKATLVVYEAPQRLAESLADAASALGPRQAAVAREITKLFETVQRGTLERLAKEFSSAPPKGEIVIVIGPPVRQEVDDGEVDRRLAALLERETVRDAANAVARDTGRSRRDVYGRALALASGRRFTKSRGQDSDPP
jgi:16S rRNA (cytidine1402-2'-O)-methyltransferase